MEMSAAPLWGEKLFDAGPFAERRHQTRSCGGGEGSRKG